MSIQKIRDNSQGLVSKIIVGLVALTFAVFGLEALRGGGNSSDVASVNGEQVTDQELLRAMEGVKSRILANMGENADPDLIDEAMVKNEALKSLIGREVLLQDADNQGMFVSNRQIDKNIISTPAFQIDGVFDKQTYEAVLRRVGYVPLDYRTQLGNDLKLQQLLSGISQSAFATRQEIEQITRLDRQQRDIAYLAVIAAQLASTEDITAAEINNWYQAHQDQYVTDEVVSIQYLELKQSDFMAQIEVSDAELEQQYQQEVEGYKLRQERHAAHILVAADDRTDAEAMSRIEEVQSKLAAKEDFASLAKQYSDDPGSAETGGDLGYTERGAFEKSFESALFSLRPGQISDIVKTEFGYTIIKLLDIRDQQPPLFDEIRGQLADEIKYRKAEELFVVAEEQLSNDSFSAGDLEEPAENLELAIQETDFFGRTGGADIISANQKVVRTAFSKEVLLEGMNSELITLDRGHVVVLRLKEHKPAQIRPFEAVSNEIRDHLVKVLAGQKAEQKAQQLLAELRAGKTPAQITESYGYQWTTVAGVKRNQDNLTQAVTEKVFQMPKPDVDVKTMSSLTQENGDVLVITLSKVSEGGLHDMNEQDIKPFQRFLANQIGNFDYLEYQEVLNNRADIEIY